MGAGQFGVKKAVSWKICRRENLARGIFSDRIIWRIKISLEKCFEVGTYSKLRKAVFDGHARE